MRRLAGFLLLLLVRSVNCSEEECGGVGKVNFHGECECDDHFLLSAFNCTRDFHDELGESLLAVCIVGIAAFLIPTIIGILFIRLVYKRRNFQLFAFICVVLQGIS